MAHVNHDLELGIIAKQTVGRRSTWIPNIIRRSTTLASTSTSRTLKPSEAELFASLSNLTLEESRCKDDLIAFMIGDQVVKRSLEIACSWYARYLQCKFNNHWHTLAVVLIGLNDNSTEPRPGDLVVVFKYMLFVAQLLKSQQNLCLVDIVDEMDNERIMKPQLDGERAKSNQLAFATVGWLSMLFEAVSYPEVDKLEVTNTSTNSAGIQNPILTRKYNTFHQGFDRIDSPLFSLLGRFGDLIPGARLQNNTDLHTIYGPTSNVITMQSVCFSNLRQYTGLSIEWVTSLALHLELDSGRKTLKVFQYPSFCRMMVVKKRGNLLSQVLDDNAAKNSEDVTVPEVPTEELFEELIRTYRLLFGQDERSWKAFAAQVSTSADSIQIASTAWASDPLLYTLCGMSCSSNEARQVFDDLNSSPQADYYDPCLEFPFFGRKLIELQQFVKQHQPQNLKALMNDRRDVGAWLNLWSTQLLVFFATFTIFLMILSLIFQVWQVQLAKQQIQQGSS